MRMSAYESIRTEGDARSRSPPVRFASGEPDRNRGRVARQGGEQWQPKGRTGLSLTEVVSEDAICSCSKPCCVMRKPAHVLYTLDDYIRDGILKKTDAQLLREAIDQRLNVVVAGGTGSGKTTLAGAMINEMVERSDPNERYVIIEDTLEIQCRAQNLVQLHTAEGADMTRLVRTTMRLRPDRIIIGEVRGAEALALLKAWNTGHPGGVTTIHANSARAALTRLSSLVQETGVPPQPELIAETANLLVLIVRTPQGRKITELVSVERYDAANGFSLKNLSAQQGLGAVTA